MQLILVLLLCNKQDKISCWLENRVLCCLNGFLYLFVNLSWCCVRASIVSMALVISWLLVCVGWLVAATCGTS